VTPGFSHRGDDLVVIGVSENSPYSTSIAASLSALQSLPVRSSEEGRAGQGLASAV
jgi:hypothetical protein